MRPNLRFLENTHHDASPGSEAWSYTSGLLTGRAIVTGLMPLPLNPFWNKVKYQEFKKDHILKSSTLSPGFLLSLPVVIRHWNSLKFVSRTFCSDAQPSCPE